jgi:hypothetical protein
MVPGVAQVVKMNVGQPGLTHGWQPMAAAKVGVPERGTVAARKH